MKKSILFILAIVCLFIAVNAYALTAYYIQVAHNDRFFIINNEKFEAKTYCFGWKENDRVIFLDRFGYGNCISATIHNFDKKSTCEFWCK